jgi:magnesium chelatase subunit D
VALVAFRGTEAELLLPPTRSLVQTKRRLAGLPGGGGTPLAAGLKAAMAPAPRSTRWPPRAGCGWPGVGDPGRHFAAREPKAAALAGAMGGRYLPLPRADAERLSAAVSTALEV